MIPELFLSAFLRALLDRLTRKFKAYSHKEGIGKKVKKWRETLFAIEAGLCDAEEKQLKSRAVKLWLDDLKDLAHDVEDILDKFDSEMLRRKANEPNQTGVSKVRGLFPNVKLHFNMKQEIEDITNRLHEISERKDKLALVEIGDIPPTVWKRPPSSCVLDGVPVVGRDSDRGKIVELLSRNEPNDVNFQVVAIVGMPGIGKTTLAQYVFNSNSDVLKEFNFKIWVSVSDDFNVVRVTKAILESVSSKRCDLDEFSNMQSNLCKELTVEKAAIPLHVGAPGSKIIVTTRDVEVAEMMRATKVHSLTGISNDDCWKVFEQHASFDVNNEIPPNFKLLQEKIVAKCGGLPLAAKTLGGRLGFKKMTEWEKILNNKLWILSDESGILQALQLSYHYLPSNLKRCFAYCSILPKDYEFGERQLILLWMAEGLLEQPEKSRHLEDVGSEYFSELLSRSLFQKSSKSNSRYVMHDLVSDLAQKVAGEICFRLEDKPDGSCSPRTRHLSYIAGKYDGVKKFDAVAEVKRLRTFLPLTISDDPCNYLTSKVTLDLLPKLQYLRVLSLNGYRISQLPDSIGEKKFLRYLDLSHTEITSLPESTSTLYNLQTLILDSCYSLKALPPNMKNLINLRHLSNSNTPLLEGMPAQLGHLTNLQTLHNFVVGRGSNSRIREIEPLLHLQGTLRLSRLENVNDIEDAKRADFVSKDGLEVFLLEWGGTGEKELDLLNELKPHGKLKVLSIKGYGGLKFSTWIGHPLFSKMTFVRVEDCKNCRFLPPLGQLPSLRKLIIKRMYRVESVGLEFYGKDNLPFPLLENLEFEEMKDWKEWVPFERDQGIGAFPCLKMLSVSECPKLEGRLPKNLALLSKLVIRGCEQLVVSIANYKLLQKLDIYDCKGVVHGCATEFQLLETLDLSWVSEFTLHTKAFLGGLKKLDGLTINYCEELTLWQNENSLLEHLISLHCLVIRGNSHFHFVQQLASLHVLHIYDCPSLFSFQEFGLPPSLKEIKIEQCNSLVYFARGQMPSNLRRIEILSCENFKSLVVEEIKAPSSSSSAYLMHDETSCLEYLSIEECPSLMSLSFRGHLPHRLKYLHISDCEQLESITDRFHDSTCLEDIRIWHCANLKHLPEGLCLLTNLQELGIYDCGSLVSFPGEGFPSSVSNLREIDINYCTKLETLPKGMHNLNSLQRLEISYCEGFASFLEEGFPLYLTSLTILKVKSCKPLFDWGLYRLTSLREFEIRGEDPNLVSFPPENLMVLPKSLVRLTVHDFPNLTKLTKGFQLLTSLQSLQIEGCPKLASIPEEGLPLSLTQLTIYHCPLLRKRCKPGKGRFWPAIAHIPYIRIQDNVQIANPTS